MNEPLSTLSKKAGLPPGALVHVGRSSKHAVKITVIDYDEKNFLQSECRQVDECYPFKTKDSVSWINVDGLHNTDKISDIGSHFGLHPLLLEDILNTHHRPKVEEFDECLFLTFKMLGVSKDGHSVVTEQISLVLGDKWVLSFQEQEGDVFDALRNRIKENLGHVRKYRADFLFYRLIDTVVDNYFIVTEHFSEAIERLQERVLINPDTSSLHELQRLKKMIISFRKSVLPIREAISTLEKGDSDLLKNQTMRYLRDVYEHIIQVIDSIETQRELLAAGMELYHSGVSQKMNQVMQVLTIISTIFIPLTFIAGVYGMNFNNMPELGWKYGYYGVLGLMLAILIIMVAYFKRKKWL